MVQAQNKTVGPIAHSIATTKDIHEPSWEVSKHICNSTLVAEANDNGGHLDREAPWMSLDVCGGTGCEYWKCFP